MSFDLVRIFHEMGVFQTTIVTVLAVMGIASLAVFVERLWGLWRMRVRSQRFAAEMAGTIASRDYESIRRATQGGKVPLAVLLGGALKGYFAENPGGLSPVEAARREVGRRTEALSATTRRGMGVLASVGSVAPFVGLLGTVVGIIAAFEGIAAEGSAGLGAIASGIAEALVVTALGLVVAIPAVLMFNFVSGRADSLMLTFGHAGSEFIDHLEAGHVRTNSPQPGAHVALGPDGRSTVSATV